jgi:hypothetical protein
MELKLDNTGIIDELHKNNVEKYNQVQKLQEQINIIKNEISQNKLKIQELCEHKYERISQYGERTHHVCYKCDFRV